MSKKVPLIVKHLDTMSSIITDEDLLAIIHDNTVGELQVFAAAKLVKDIAHLIKNNNTHDLQNYHFTDKKIVGCHRGDMSITNNIWLNINSDKILDWIQIFIGI